MNCPLCSAATDDGAAECPSCGAIFSKLRERQEREKKKATAALAQAETPATSPSFNPWSLRIAAAALVAAWLLGVSLYYRARAAKIPRQSKPRAYDAPSSAQLRNPATGKLESVEVHLSPLSSRPEPPPPPAAEPARPPDAPAYDPDFDD